MRIALDGHTLGTRAGGNERYVRGLVEGFAAIRANDEILVYSTPSIPSTNENVRFVSLRSRGAVGRLAGEFPQRLASDGVDVAHFQYVGPLRCPCPLVLAIHDASFCVAPELLGWKMALRLRVMMRWSLRTAAAILVPSRWTEETLAHFYPTAAARIHRIPLGVSDRFDPEPHHNDAELRRSLGLPERYLLFVGRRQRRKNVSGLLDAYETALRLDGSLPPLVLVGPDSHHDAAVLRSLSRRKLENRVALLTAVSDTSLPGIYRGADFLCFPCRYEGFGLPVLEAMACGCPVIAADEGGLPELVEEAGIFLPPQDTTAWGRAMVALHRDSERRRCLARQGVERAQLYSWTVTAAKTLDQCRAVCQAEGLSPEAR